MSSLIRFLATGVLLSALAAAQTDTNIEPHVGDVVDLAVITHPSGNPIDTANTKSASPDAFLAEVATMSGVTDCVDWILDPATLRHAISECRAAGKRLQLATETEEWLEAVPTDIDFDTWRRQMIARTEKLLELKPQ